MVTFFVKCKKLNFCYWPPLPPSFSPLPPPPFLLLLPSSSSSPFLLPPSSSPFLLLLPPSSHRTCFWRTLPQWLSWRWSVPPCQSVRVSTLRGGWSLVLWTREGQSLISTWSRQPLSCLSLEWCVTFWYQLTPHYHHCCPSSIPLLSTPYHHCPSSIPAYSIPLLSQFHTRWISIPYCNSFYNVVLLLVFNWSSTW